MSSPQLLQTEWPVPQSVNCIVTTRNGGVSLAPFDSLNLAMHVGDVDARVQENRAILQTQFSAVKEWQWLKQVHGAQAHRIDAATEGLIGDALITGSTGLACCILTADCLPVLICNDSGSEVAAAHGGWRGLAQGVLESTVAGMRSKPESLMAWLGPAIGPCCFEVGKEVRDAFLTGENHEKLVSQFESLGKDKYLANLYGIARVRLESLGVTRIVAGEFCTYCDSSRFYSYRRDGQCGRMLSAIYLI